jgi:Domain of unknown function (DUF5615)
MGTLTSELQPIAADLASAPRVYVDANVPAGAVAFMRHELHWDVLFVLEHDDLRRARDADHYQHAREFGRTLITLDRDFLDDRHFPPDQSPGLIVCSAPDERWLFKLLSHVERTIFRAAAVTDLPLRGRKVMLTIDALVEVRGA